MNYALIENGTVINIIYALPSAGIPNIIPIGDLPVQVGDTYADGKFYHNGEEVRAYIDELYEALSILGVAE